PGVSLTVRGRLTADRGRIWETEGEITGEDGTLYARGWGKYMPMSAEQTQEVMAYLHFDSDTVPRSALAPERAPEDGADDGTPATAEDAESLPPPD
ncbi:MAG: hypothetical protein LC772_10605, partial [Chloroflexi bacterium]|nr:hypothetical protein [Chloroflexota bacterium]